MTALTNGTWGGWSCPLFFMKWDMMSMGMGKTIVLLFSAEMLFKVCRYLSWGQQVNGDPCCQKKMPIQCSLIPNLDKIPQIWIKCPKLHPIFLGILSIFGAFFHILVIFSTFWAFYPYLFLFFYQCLEFDWIIRPGRVTDIWDTLFLLRVFHRYLEQTFYGTIV